MRRAAWVLVLTTVATLAGCDVTRTGLVPRPRTPLGYDGQPLRAPVAFTASGETTVIPAKPRQQDGNGSFVARDHGALSARIRSSPNTEVALLAAGARGAGGVSLGPADPADFEDDIAFAFGAAFRGSANLDDGWRLGMSVELQIWSLPLSSGTSTEEAALNLTLMPSYRRGRFTAWGGLTVATELSVPASRAFLEDETTSSLVPVGHVGARFDVAPHVALAAHVAASINSQGGDVPLAGLTMIVEP